MKTLSFTTALGGLFLLFSCTAPPASPDGDSQYQAFAPDGIPFVVADSAWKADLRGNHRAVVEVDDTAFAVRAFLPWRRPDLRPESKKVVVVDARTGEEVQNVLVSDFSAEAATVTFEPQSGRGTYYVYYLPYRFRRGWDDARYGNPWNDYLPPVYATDSLWALRAATRAADARVVRFESRSRFDAFTPMGLAATRRETDSLRQVCPHHPVLFAEDRAFPIRLTRALPARWARENRTGGFSGTAMRNEYYVWQLGVWASRGTVKNVQLRFSDLVNGDAVIPHDSLTCFNLEGTNWDGQPMRLTVDVPDGGVQALWCGVQIPDNAEPGIYRGTVGFSCDGGEAQTLPLEIRVEKERLADKGDADLWRHARLRWLNSTIGADLEPVKPYADMQLEGRTLRATGKELRLADNGLPASVRINGREVLAAPFRFVVQTAGGPVGFEGGRVALKQEAGGRVSWTASDSCGGMRLDCRAYMEYDGFVHYDLRLSSAMPQAVKDIRLETDYTPHASAYFMGAGYGGGKRPDRHEWNWQGPWDSYWMGNADAGLHVEYRGGSYHGPLLNDYKPAPPRSWANGGRGRIRLVTAGAGGARVVAATGADSVGPQARSYEFDLLITPVRPLDTRKHFSQRYYHARHDGFDQAAREGANIINIHHAQPLNPVINYPFVVQDSLKAFIRHEHEEGRKVKLYYTIRELSNYATEIYALKSLNHEILAPGVGYGLPWHCEHLIDDYRPAWYTELPGEHSDAALVLSGFSRWINYYLEGLRWMFENYELDGIYMDDVSFDRPVMKRMRKIFERYRPGALIDLHSNTAYSVGPANQYTGFFPYVDRLWFGESFQYDRMRPDEWLVTFSGIPFGQMSEMLQGGGNRFLGMVYGATGRHSYSQFSPAPVWALWKQFGIEEARMVGYWDDSCPVRTSSEEVKATAYVKPGSVLVAVGNFGDSEALCRLSFDWKALGLDPSRVSMELPAVENFQEARSLTPGEALRIAPKEGCLLWLKAR